MVDGFNRYRQNGYVINFYENTIDSTEQNTELDSEFETHINNFLKMLMPYKDGFLWVTKKNTAYLFLSIYGVEMHAWLWFKQNILSKLLDLNIDLSVDIYGDGTVETK